LQRIAAVCREPGLSISLMIRHFNAEVEADRESSILAWDAGDGECLHLAKADFAKIKTAPPGEGAPFCRHDPGIAPCRVVLWS
jgi:hypothetical protein